MPHNNRMSTSGSLKTHDIWSKTIGHDPYANSAEQEDQAGGAANAMANAEKVKNVMEMARTQNVTDGADRHGFTAKLYLGLKKGKVRRSGNGPEDSLSRGDGLADPKLRKLLEDPDSSSEEEFVEQEEAKEENDNDNDADQEEEESQSERKKTKDRRRKKKKRRTKRRRRRSDSSSDSSSNSSSDEDSEDSSDEDRRRRKRRKRRRRESSSRRHSKRRRKDSRRRRERERDEILVAVGTNGLAGRKDRKGIDQNEESSGKAKI